MRKKLEKDKKNRKLYVLREGEYQLRKSLLNNTFINSKEYFVSVVDSKVTKIVNRCLVSGRAGGINRKHKLSRNILLGYVKQGMIKGLRKIR